MFAANFATDASGAANLSFTLIYPGARVNISVQSKGGQSVIQSNDFATNPDAARALALLDADFAKNGDPPTGTLGTADIHPLDVLLIVDGGAPLLCESHGALCATEMAAIARKYQLGISNVDVNDLAGSCGPCPKSRIASCDQECLQRSWSRQGGADPCLVQSCTYAGWQESKNTDLEGWACVYNCGGGAYRVCRSTGGLASQRDCEYSGEGNLPLPYSYGSSTTF
jgi:hypothetical protein